MNIDFKPAVRFLKKMVDKGAEITKNIAAYAKQHPVLTGGVAAVIVAAHIISLEAGGVITGISIWALNGAGKYDRARDERDKAFAARAKAQGFAERPSQP